ncbi:acyl-CoA dehydrogenase family protein [Pseudonocardia benzenivorans]|uniref:Acyl-CoA dehydrogenase domain-containing protein n=2 Tax=Pseudonocardia TaxID=1847 RepID=F4CMG1_PSEUX|nr:acyl-CoA dehydrogenase family protein [Pseudonocardia dioxanivorans]AEA23588.1 acyl-CoA dehydrogenase domain-containing protein [Pseudonocardia dioxanivorans CB1190]
MTAELDLVVTTTEDLLRSHPPARTPRRDFLAAQFDAGLAWVHFPVGSGGLGVAPPLQREVTLRLADAGAPDGAEFNRLGYSMGAPTLAAWGTRAQQERYLRPLFVGDERWCQLFSEPGAGSDLAGLSTRAVRDGDAWVVNGQKVWSSLATISQVGMLIARTDPEQPKHRGLTYFLVDMDAPGVEVRPLRQLTGEAEFNEVYLTDVRVPDSARVGEVSDGWRVAMTTLMEERVLFNRERTERTPADLALELYRTRPDPGPELRTRMIDLWVRARVQRLNSRRAAANRTAGIPGPEGSIGKLVYAELNQDALELCLDLLGDESMLYDSYEMSAYTEESLTRRAEQDVRRLFLRSRAYSIEGGTSEIMRNILAERVLGLPPEPRTDKNVPFSRIPRG